MVMANRQHDERSGSAATGSGTAVSWGAGLLSSSVSLSPATSPISPPIAMQLPSHSPLCVLYALEILIFTLRYSFFSASSTIGSTSLALDLLLKSST
ncbi:hypothetical protein HUJ04_005793 [Dendroctonus ponderosae]|nr:hypothetical protein HUJ04_005793 [Dendroctonus ponderosae]